MAENPEETAENVVEEVASGGGDERGEAASASADEAGRGGERSETPGAFEAASGTRKERNAAARSAKAAKPSGPRTIEDRIADRKAHRERNARQRRAYRAKLKAKRAEVRAATPVVEVQRASEQASGKPKVRQGVVISDKGDKTLTVRIDIVRRHKRYHKILRHSMTLYVHDEANDANTGDTVRVQECRPMSRMKRWRLLEVLERAR